MGPSRCQQIKWVLNCVRVVEKQGPLAEVVEHQRWQDHCEPAEADGPPAEMAHIRIHGLATRDGEESRAKHGKANAQSGVCKVQHGMVWTECAQDNWASHDAIEAE